MQIDAYVTALREDVARFAALGDESTARAADLVAFALESAFVRRMQQALTEAALELTEQLPGEARVDVRIAGGDPQLVYVSDETLGAGVDAQDGAFTARITLRLPEGLKLRLEGAASAGGASVNSWVVHALTRALDTPSRPATYGGGRRMTGQGKA